MEGEGKQQLSCLTLPKGQCEPKACDSDCDLGVSHQNQKIIENQARFGCSGVEKRSFVVVPVRAFILNRRDLPSSMSCLSPGLPTYQPPLSPLSQALSAGQAEPPPQGQAAARSQRGERGELTLLSAPLYLSVYCTLCACTLAPYQAIKGTRRGLTNPARSGLCWSCTRGVKLPMKPAWVGFLPLP